VGLGNPGPKYQNTRHNIGFITVDALAKKLEPGKNAWAFNKKCNAEIVKGSSVCPSAAELRVSKANPDEAKRRSLRQARTNDEPVPIIILAKPQTLMNNSGYAVAKIARYYKIAPQNIWVIYDDIDLALGTLRIRSQGSSGGHKGVQSIIDHLGSNNFTRFRLGIGQVPAGIDPADYVLSKITKNEIDVVKNMIDRAVVAVLKKI
jgi:PTH1 family peptidyl-tRNA hydrolase